MAECSVKATDSCYDPELSYEERMKRRRLKRELKREKVANSTPGSYSNSHTSSQHSSLSLSSPTSKHLQNGTTSNKIPSSIVTTNQTVMNGGLGDVDRKRLNSPRPENANHSSRTAPTQISLANSRVQPVSKPEQEPTIKTRTYSDSTILDSTKKPLIGSNHQSVPRSSSPHSPQSPHSPLIVGQASRLLSGVIAKQQERERSCSPLSTPPVIKSVFTFDRTSGGSDTNTASIWHGHTNNSDQSQSETSRYSRNKLTSEALSKVTSKQNDYNTLASVDSGFSRTTADTRENMDGGTMSRQSTLSSSSSFTFEHPDQLISPTQPKLTTPPPQSFASSLKFVETDFPPTSPLSMVVDEPTSIRGRMQKSNVVYESHEDENSAIITRIPSSGFFDPSQTQSQSPFDSVSPPMTTYTAYYTGNPEKEMDKNSTDGGKIKDQKKQRSTKSPLRHFKKNPADKIEEEDEGELDSGNGEMRKSSRKEKKEKEGRKFFRKRSFSDGSALDNNHDELLEKNKLLEKNNFQSPDRIVVSSSMRSALPITPFKMLKQTTVSQSFRAEPRGKSLPPDDGGWSKFSMPNLVTPPNQSREVTPESGASDSSSGGRNTRHRMSFTQKIKSLVVGSNKDDGAKSTKGSMSNPVVLKAYKMLDDSPAPELDEKRRYTVTDKDRTECISLGVNERSVDVPPASKMNNSGKVSGNIDPRGVGDTKTPSSRESSGGQNHKSDDLVKSGKVGSVSKDSKRNDSLSSSTKKVSTKDETSVDHISSSTKDSSKGNKKTTIVSRYLLPKASQLSTKTNKTSGEISSSKITVTSKKGTSSKTSASLTKNNHSTGSVSSPKGSPILSKKTGKVTNSKVSSSKTSKSFPKESPLVTKKTASTSLTKDTTKVGSGPKTVIVRSHMSPSPKLSPQKIVVSSLHYSPTSSPRPTKKSTSSVTTSPLVTKKLAPSNASNTSPKTQNTAVTKPASKRPVAGESSPFHSSPQSSVKKSSISSLGKSSPKNGSPQSSVRKTAPPLLTKVSLEASKEAEKSPNFSRFSRSRQPIKLKSPDQSKSSSPVLKHDPKGPDTPNSHRKRKVGVSTSAPHEDKKFITNDLESLSSSSSLASNHLPKMDMNVDHLLARVEQRLNNITMSDSDTENPIPVDFKSSSVFNPASSENELEHQQGSQPSQESPLVKQKYFSKEEKSSKSSSVLSTFTSARPPKHPSKISSETQLISKKSSNSAKLPTSSTGVSRPRLMIVADPNKVSSPSSNTSSSKNTPTITHNAISSSTLSGDSDKKKLKGSSDVKPASSNQKSSVSATKNSNTRQSAKNSIGVGQSSRNSTLNRSMKSRSSTHIRPNVAANLTSHRGSLPSSSHSTSNLNCPLSGQPSNRKSLRRANSGESLTKKIRPSATLNRDKKISAAGTSTTTGAGNTTGGVYASMRRPRSGSLGRTAAKTGPGLTRSTATMSMRLPRNSLGQRSSTLRKSSRGAPATSTVSDTTTLSPSRSSTLKRVSSGGTLRKVSCPGEVLSAFDHVSAQASVLTSSDHRRAVRPKLRQKASATHLKMLRQRIDVSSEIATQDENSSKIDPNTYSTYMAKKNLAPSAMAGLAASVDFSTVKLRRTGTFQQMLTDQAKSPVDNRSASPNPAAGMEYSTSHPVMLLQIKGRRYIQTRLVEPSANSMNSGDVFLVVTKDKLFHWVGKSSNVIEKARGSDVVMRIIHKKELGCKATAAVVLKEEECSHNQNSKREGLFWELLGGKKGIKSSESAPGDDLYEKAVNLATTVYLLEGDKDTAQFVPIHEGTAKMVTVGLLCTKDILLFDFYSEVYVWVGNQSQAALRRKAMELGKQMFDIGCKHPVFNLRSSPARASGRYRPKSSVKSPRHSVLNASGRRLSRASKEVKPRPEWALFDRVTEGSEHILFREKFGDWPEAGRIIKMKGHVSSGEVQQRPTIQIELKPADVEKMMKDIPPFEGLRLEGDNIYRGHGNYKVSKSSFACNRARTVAVKKWVIKEFDNVVVPDQQLGIFYSSEAYIIRWGFQITVVRELEGLVPGQGLFARDRAYQKSLQEAQEGKNPVEKKKKISLLDDELDSGSSDEENEEEKRLLESGGRDRCSYFFWQGESCTINEKGASALMTVELDKEKGPQIRVIQGKEPPAFFNLFNGGMIILKGRSENNSLKCKNRSTRVFCTRGQVKNEACLVEVTPSDERQCIGTCLRSRGCYVVYHVKENRLFLWYGSKCTKSLKKSGTVAGKMLKNRLTDVEMIRVNEGEEPNDLCSLLGNKESYLSIAKDTHFTQYTPRLFELSSVIGEFVANEVLSPSRNGETEAFTFVQADLYSAVQPAIFLLDGYSEIYVWLGWWPEEKNKLLREANATTGSSHAHWLRDKRLALETAQHYIKACNRTRTPRAHVVLAGTEHDRFKNLFPFWEDSKAVQELNCKGKPIPKRVDIETELSKYSRSQFTVEELKQKPTPEGVDPAKLETYLSDTDFKRVFKMDRAEFSRMPLWKQTKQKKEVGLF